MSEYRDSYEIIEAAADALDQAAADAELMPGPFEAAVSKDKGGGSAPTEDPNTLQSRAVARVIDLISEGPIVGLYTGEGAEGKDNPLKAVYFNNIPVMDSTGSLNYEGLTMEERTGLPDQAVIPDFPEVESEITVNQQVEDASPVLFIIADDDVDSIRLKLRIPALYEQVSSGSLVASTLQFTVKVQPFGGSFTTVIDDTVTGKNTSIYERQHKISLGDKGAFPLTFKVERVTADSDKASKQQDLFVNSYTEIQEAQLTYPDSALVAIAVDSELFSGRVPQRSFFVRGLIIQVPSNYFPETGLYHRRASDGADMGTDQIWDGTLYSAWTNNPAWVLFDILTNERYGLGEFIDDVDQVDRFALYEIGVYCDELVDTGLGDGTQERRFVFNAVINTREDAYDVVNAITSTFRGMSYWSSAGVTAVADSPKDPKRVITRANISGDFNYSGTALRTQHSAALVSYNDPTNNYKQTIEVVEDPVRRERYGWRELEVVAFGTTSRGQAYRLGRFILFSEERENETLTFTGTFDVSDLRPGDVINVADPARQGLRTGGRIISYTAGSPGVIVLDAEIDASDGDSLLVRTVEGGMESLDIEAADLSATVTLKSGEVPTANLQVNSVFLHRGVHLVPETWRILSVREAAPNKWEFACLTYDASKFAAIEANIFLEAPPTTFLPSGPLLPATGLTVFESLDRVGNAVNVVIDVSWTRSTDPRATFYLVEFRFKKLITDNDSAWQQLPPGTTAGIHAVVPNGEDGFWSFRVTAMNGDGVSATSRSAPLVLSDQEIIGKSEPPPNVLNLTAVRGFDEVVLDWDDVNDIDLDGYEVRRGASWDDAATEVLARNLRASTYTATVKTAEVQNYHVRAVDTMVPPNYSREVATIATSIQALPAVENLVAHQVDDSLRIDWDTISGTEAVNYEVRYGATATVFAKANELATVVNSNYIGPLPVNVTQEQRIWVRPFVILDDDSFSYGTEASYDVDLFPLNRGLQVLSRTEETAWTGIPSNIATSLLEGGDVDEEFASGNTINTRTVYTPNKNPGRVGVVKDAAFHCNMTVASGTLPLGTVMEGGDSTTGALVCFDGSGNLIVRAGSGRAQQDSLTDLTSVLHRWTMSELPGETREDSIGSNDLTENGTVTIRNVSSGIVGAYTAAFDGTAGSYLSASDISIAGKDWTLAFWLDLDIGYGGTGKVFQLGTGTTLSAELVASRLVVTVQDSGGDHSVTYGVDLNEGAGPLHFIITFDDTSKDLLLYYADVLQDTQTAASSLVDGSGELRIGESFLGAVSDVWWAERVITSDEREDLNEHCVWSASLARISIPYASIPLDSAFDFAFDFHVGGTDGIDVGRVRAWINDTPYSAVTPWGKYLGLVARWASTSNGKYNGPSGTHPEGESGVFDAPLNGQVTLNSDLSYWHDQQIGHRLEISADELTLTEGSTSGSYEFPFNLPGTRIGRLWVDMVASSIAADALEIFDANMEIFDATFDIAESNPDFRPQVALFIDLENTGTFIPLVPATYQFLNSTIRVVLTRGENETTRPAITSLTAHFIEQPVEITLQAETTDATKTTLTYDGAAVSASNIPLIPDDFMARIDGRMIAWKNDNSERAEYTFTCILKRGTGVGSTVIESWEIEEDEDDTDWLLELEADTTHGGLQVNFTGKAATTIKSLCDVNITKVGI